MGPEIHKFPPLCLNQNDLWTMKERKVFLVQTLCFLFESVSNLQKVMEAELACRDFDSSFHCSRLCTSPHFVFILFVRLSKTKLYSDVFLPKERSTCSIFGGGSFFWGGGGAWYIQYFPSYSVSISTH
jgi:hypothetical protein